MSSRIQSDGKIAVNKAKFEVYLRPISIGTKKCVLFYKRFATDTFLYPQLQFYIMIIKLCVQYITRNFITRKPIKNIFKEALKKYRFKVLFLSDGLDTLSLN